MKVLVLLAAGGALLSWAALLYVLVGCWLRLPPDQRGFIDWTAQD
jgi:hypothetical protein